MYLQYLWKFCDRLVSKEIRAILVQQYSIWELEKRDRSFFLFKIRA